MADPPTPASPTGWWPRCSPIREAALTAMRESLEATEVTAAQLTTARQAIRPSLDPVQLAELAGYAEARP